MHPKPIQNKYTGVIQLVMQPEEEHTFPRLRYKWMGVVALRL
jgi:hypothetical protein